MPKVTAMSLPNSQTSAARCHQKILNGTELEQAATAKLDFILPRNSLFLTSRLTCSRSQPLLQHAVSSAKAAGGNLFATLIIR